MTQKTDNIYEEFDARVEKFMRKQMTAEEEQQFKEELAADPDKKSRARAMALMASQMRDIRRKQETAAIQQMSGMSETEFRKVFEMQNALVMQNAECRMQNQKHSDNNAQPNSEFRILHSALIRRISIAACMIGVLTVGGIQYNAYNRTTALGDTYYSLVSSDISNQRGDLDAKTKTTMEQLFAEVAKGENLEEAIANLTMLYKESDDAQDVGRGFPSRQPEPDLGNFRQTIAWNLALAHLKDGNRNDAKEILLRIVAENEPDKAIVQSATKLLGEIADIPSLW